MGHAVMNNEIERRTMTELVTIASRILSWATRLAIAAVVIQTVGHLVNALLLDHRVLRLSADSDFSIGTWMTSTATFTAGAAAVVSGLAVPERRSRLFLLGGILILLAFDDALAVHELLSLSSESYARLLWPALYSPVLIVTFLLLRSEARDSPAIDKLTIIKGLGLLVGAVLLEAATTVPFLAGMETDDFLYIALVAVEEAAELAAWVLIAGALISGAFINFARYVARNVSQEGRADR
jgi:hypothetical protein